MRFLKTRELLKGKGIEDDSPLLEFLPDWLRKSYLEEINHCEHLNCKNKNLQVHRKKRAWDGGKYCPDNVKIVCNIHHSYYHSNEFITCKSK